MKNRLLTIVLAFLPLMSWGQGTTDPQPYAVLTENNTVLTFYYDDQKAERGGIAFLDGTNVYWPSSITSVTQAVFDSSFADFSPTSTAYWFNGLSGLTIVTGLEYLNTEHVTDMYGMFHGCSGLTSLDVSGFKTDNVTGMSNMFSGCSGLTSLDVSGFNTANVTDMSRMFEGCSSLKTIYVGNDWSTASVTDGSEMFSGCTSLVGGMGTVYDANHTDHTYAHVDVGTANPGYFTLSGDSPYVPVDVTFDNHGVLTVGGTATMTEALETVGGVSAVAETITAIVWNSTAALTNSDLQDLHNPNMLIYVEVDTLAPVNRDNVIVGDLAKNIVLTDVSEGNGNFYCPMEFKAEMIIYTHDYNQTTEVGVACGWETIALPFDVQTIMHEKQGLIAPFGNSTSGKHFWLRQPTENGLASATIIEANTAYLISMPNSDAYSSEFNLNGHVTFSSQNVWVPKTMINGVDFHTKDNTLVVLLPNFQRQASDDMIYALNVGEQRGNYPEGSVFEREYRAVRPFEAYTIHMGGPAPQFISFFDMNGGMTGIESLTPSRSEGDGAWYTIDGRKLQTKPTQKGVYILNGRKAVVK